MADVVTTQVLKQNPSTVVLKLTNVSDGTGEASVLKVDASTFTGHQAGAKFNINKIAYNITGGSVVLTFDGATDATAVVLSGDGMLRLDEEMAAPIPDNSVTPTGDILLSTRNFTAASGYTIILNLKRVGFTWPSGDL
jgi:hypothetical protein